MPYIYKVKNLHEAAIMELIDRLNIELSNGLKVLENIHTK